MGIFRGFFTHGTFQRSLNSTFLVLIPKRVGAKDLKDFRQISLVRGLYKLLAKVLANRLKKVVGKVVSNFQYAFMLGRKILDAVLIASKAIELRLKTNLFDLILKMNIEKAYDHVNWNFLLAIMSTNEVWEKWIS